VKGIKMNSKRKVILTTLKVFLLALSFLAIIVLASCMGGLPFSNNSSTKASAQSQGMQTYTVVRGNILQESSTTGAVDAKKTNTYTFEVTGKVTSAFEQGDTFKKNDLLVTLDDSEGVAKIDELEDTLLTAEDDLASSKNSITTAKINYQKALDANHIAIQLADLNTQKAQEASASALLSLQNANRSADLAWESAVSSLESTKDIADWSLESAQDALHEAKRILKEEEAKPAPDPDLIAKYEYNVETAKNKLDQAEAEQDSSISSAEDKIGSTDIQNSSSLDSAQNSYDQALNEQSSTYWNNLSSQESAAEQIKLAQLNINDASLKLKQAERSVENAREDIEDAKKDLEDYKIAAPYDGIITSTGYIVGENSSQGGSGISIINNEYIIKATISENDMPKVKVGNAVVISLDAYSDIELNGTLEKINPISTNTNGIVTYDVWISFQDAKDVELFYGLSANLSIITAKAENVLYVPLQSVYKENGKSYVDVLRTGQTAQDDQVIPQTSGSQPSQPNQSNQQNKANQTKTTAKGVQVQSIEKVEVTTGINDYVNIEIKSGISEGDIIVTSKVAQ
jgi:HlyD family secretion protein